MVSASSFHTLLLPSWVAPTPHPFTPALAIVRSNAFDDTTPTSARLVHPPSFAHLSSPASSSVNRTLASDGFPLPAVPFWADEPLALTSTSRAAADSTSSAPHAHLPTYRFPARSHAPLSPTQGHSPLLFAHTPPSPPKAAPPADDHFHVEDLEKLEAIKMGAGDFSGDMDDWNGEDEGEYEEEEENRERGCRGDAILYFVAERNLDLQDDQARGSSSSSALLTGLIRTSATLGSLSLLRRQSQASPPPARSTSPSLNLLLIFPHAHSGHTAQTAFQPGRGSMNNPYEEQQEAVLSRILGTVDKLNESMLELNKEIQNVNGYNASTAEVVELWTSYMRNVQWNLQSQKALHPPV